MVSDRRYLYPLEVWALAFGCSIGWGAFIMPGTTFLKTTGPLGTIIGILAGAVIMLVIGRNYHYMMNHISGSGGTFTYTTKIFGHDHGFLCAWFLCLTYIALIWANSTALALAARYIFGDVFQFGFHYQLAGYDIYFGEALICITAIVFLCSLCIFGKRLAVKAQTVMAIILFGGILICFSAALLHHEGGTEGISPLFLTDTSPVSQLIKIVALAPWAFVGFESVSHSSGEFRFKRKRMFTIFTAAIVTAALAYILLMLMPVLALPEGYAGWTDYIADLGNLSGIMAMPTFTAANVSMGSAGITILGYAMLSALITSIIGNTIALSRLMRSMSKQGILPDWFGEVNKDNVPKNAILFIIAVSVIIPFLGRTAIGWHVDVSTIGAGIAYGYTSAAAYKLAKNAGDRREQITGMLGIGLSVVFCLLLLVPNYMSGSTLAKESYLILAVWSILGFVVFRGVFKKDRERRFGKSTVVWVAILSLIFFTSMMWMREATHNTAETAVKNISGFYINEDEKQGVYRTKDSIAEENAYLAEQMDTVNDSLLNNSIIQMAMMVLSLIIMFNVYSLMRSREGEMEIAKVRAEEHSKSKSVFLSNVSHDIRTPMNAITGYTSMARAEGVSAEEMRGYLDKINVSGQQLLALLNDVLEMSRIESGKMELELSAANLGQIMDEMRDLFGAQMQSKNITYTVDTSEVTQKWVLCDKNRLNRVLLNLISNAYKFTGENGTVSVILAETGRAGQTHYYEFRVKDNGIGMSKEFAEKVFDAFEREQTSTVSGIQGTGLGMAITKSIVDLMQGTIDVITAPDKGTEFIIKVSFPEAEEEKQTDEKTTADFSGMRVLLAEDNAINREIALNILTQLGFEIETAQNGAEAVEMVKASEAGYYRAVLMDIQMPVMDGLEASRQIRALPDSNLASVPIIAMTANVFSEDYEEERKSGMNAHITKPFDIAKMINTLKEVLLDA